MELNWYDFEFELRDKLNAAVNGYVLSPLAGSRWYQIMAHAKDAGLVEAPYQKAGMSVWRITERGEKWASACPPTT
jgi:hypothetical protein